MSDNDLLHRLPQVPKVDRFTPKGRLLKARAWSSNTDQLLEQYTKDLPEAVLNELVLSHQANSAQIYDLLRKDNIPLWRLPETRKIKADAKIINYDTRSSTQQARLAKALQEAKAMGKAKASRANNDVHTSPATNNKGLLCVTEIPLEFADEEEGNDYDCEDPTELLELALGLLQKFPAVDIETCTDDELLEMLEFCSNEQPQDH